MYIMPFDPHLDTPRPARPAPADDSIRRSILDAASQAFAEKGYAATRIATIAEMAGLPKSNSDAARLMLRGLMPSASR